MAPTLNEGRAIRQSSGRPLHHNRRRRGQVDMTDFCRETTSGVHRGPGRSFAGHDEVNDCAVHDQDIRRASTSRTTSRSRSRWTDGGVSGQKQSWRMPVMALVAAVVWFALAAPTYAQRGGQNRQGASAAEAEMQKGIALARTGKFNEAIPHFLAAQGQVSDSAVLSFNLALCYVGTG